jgi:2-polyprenyl-3-methyl-5-hydroxy-6-metoxy-1,4-benzoquinol methylase
VRNWLVNTESTAVEQYREATIHAHPGLHQELAEIFARHVSVGAHVLDVGAGAGAFSLRLRDLGYEVEALDVDPSKWTASDIPFRILDLNQGLAASVTDRYDAVCCCEVIEHVENPWALMRDLYQVLKPGGVALVSTPHVTNFVSRLMFLVTGHLCGFEPATARSMGHINPIQPYEMREIIDRLG